MKELPLAESEYRALSYSLIKVEFFATLSVAEMERILSYIKLFSFEAGETVFKQGGPADALFVVYEGLLTVRKKTWFFGSRTLAELKAGDFFGEMALLDRKRRSATVQAIEPSKLFALFTSDFDRVVSNNSLFLHEMKSIADRRKFENKSLA